MVIEDIILILILSLSRRGENPLACSDHSVVILC